MTKLTRISLGLALAAIGGVVVMGSGSPAAHAANPSVSITPAQQNVAIAAGTVVYQVHVANADNVAAYGYKLKFDPYVLEFVSAANGEFLASSGRNPVCPGAIVSEAKDLVNYGCATPGQFGGAGASGSGLLTTLTFKLIGGGASSLEFTEFDLSDSTGAGACADLQYKLCTPQITQGASITVDGPVLPRPTVDPNATATSTPGAFVTPTRVIGGNTTATAGTTAAAGSTGTTGTTGTAGGTISSGGALGSEAQPGNSTAGGSQGAGASGAGVGRFGSGPDAYATGDGSGALRTGAIAIAALGMALIVVGIWQRGRIKTRRQVVRRHEP